VLQFLLHSPAQLRAFITRAAAVTAGTSAQVEGFFLGHNKVGSHSMMSLTHIR